MSTEKMSLGEIHWKTSHIRNKISPHAMDFGRYPLPFKPYDQGAALDLEAVQADPGRHLSRDGLLPFLSAFFYLSYGVTDVRQAGAIPFLSRTVPSAGGLYPCHLYLGGLPRHHGGPDHGSGENPQGYSPETNLFYYDPPGHCLTLLRRSGEGPLDFSGTVKSHTALVFMVTACLYNAAWKYRDRALRYVMLDAGHLAENLVLAGGGQAVSLTYDFDDQQVGSLLNLDPSLEVPLALVTLGWDKSVSEAVGQLAAETRPCFPDLRVRPGEAAYMEKYAFPAKIHALGRPVCPNNGIARGDVRQNPFTGNPELPGLMVRRRSRRNFIRRAVSPEDQQALLSWVVPAGEGGGGHPWITLALACQDWEGVEEGLYALDPETGRLDLMASGNFNLRLARVCLGQDWVGLAGAVFLCLADLEALEAGGGIRAYRYAMLAAGRAGQRIYLGAEATGQGCCGIGAFYDDEAAALLGLEGDTAVVYALAVGPVKKKIR